MNERYRSILNLPHHVAEGRKHMSNGDRAAQFAPFAALTGYDDAVRETARLTDSRPELMEDEKREIDSYLKILKSGISARPRAGITYFVPDRKKEGGKLVDIIAPAVEIKEDEGVIVFENGASVRFSDIVSILPAVEDGFEFELY